MACDNNYEECGGYWDWSLSNNEACNPNEASDVIGEASQESHIEMSSSLDQDLAEIVHKHNKDEILQWILESRELGLIPSPDVLKRLLHPYLHDEKEANCRCLDEDEPISDKAYWQEQPGKFSQLGEEHYWDEIPSSAFYSNDSRINTEDEVPGYWEGCATNEDVNDLES